MNTMRLILVTTFDAEAAESAEKKQADGPALCALNFAL
jgi:hypothetical protein